MMVEVSNYNNKKNYTIQTANSTYKLIATPFQNIYRISGGSLNGVREIRLMSEIDINKPIAGVFTSNRLNGKDAGELFRTSMIKDAWTYEIEVPKQRMIMVSTKNSEYLLKETLEPNHYLLSGGNLHQEIQAIIDPADIKEGYGMTAILDNGQMLKTSEIVEIYDMNDGSRFETMENDAISLD